MYLLYFFFYPLREAIATNPLEYDKNTKATYGHPTVTLGMANVTLGMADVTLGNTSVTLVNTSVTEACTDVKSGYPDVTLGITSVTLGITNVTAVNSPIIKANRSEILRKRFAVKSFAKLHIDIANKYFRLNNDVRVLKAMPLYIYNEASVMTSINILKQL